MPPFTDLKHQFLGRIVTKLKKQSVSSDKDLYCLKRHHPPPPLPPSTGNKTTNHFGKERWPRQFGQVGKRHFTTKIVHKIFDLNQPFLKKFKFYLVVPRNQNISRVILRLAYTSNGWNQKLLYNCCPKIFLSAYIHSLTVRRVKLTARFHYKVLGQKYEHKLSIKLNISKTSQWYEFLLTGSTFWGLRQVLDSLSTIFKNNKKVRKVCWN